MILNVKTKDLGEGKHLTAEDGKEKVKSQPIVKGDQVGRNDPCPCGSGKSTKIAMDKHKSTLNVAMFNNKD